MILFVLEIERYSWFYEVVDIVEFVERKKIRNLKWYRRDWG